MPKLKKQTLLSFLLVAIYALTADAQLSSKQQKILDRIKNGHTHILVNDTTFSRSVEFLTVFKKYWTLTKGVSYLKRKNLQENLVSGDTYFTLQPYALAMRYSAGIGNSYLGMLNFTLWTPKERALEKNRKFKSGDMDEIATQQLWTTKESGYSASRDDGLGSSMDYDFDGTGRIFNWSPGFLKNRLQLMQKELTTGKAADFTDDYTDKEQVKMLKDKILYIPQDNLYNYGVFAGGGKLQDTAGFFKDYKFKYQMVNNLRLEEKIFDDRTPSFYIASILSGGCKLLSVINSQTGEVIYYRFTRSTWNFKPKDLKELSRQIEK